jgi:hypothetical protein
MSRVSVTLTRDSVCAGDDGDAPHEKRIEIEASPDPGIFARELASGYLPSVAGVGHSWDCQLNGVRIATISVAGVKARVPRTPLAEPNRAHFVYHSARF